MITVEKLEKGTYFDDAFKISFRYDPTTVAKVKELAERRYLPEDRAWEIPAHELPALIEKVGLSNIKSEEAVVQALNTKEIEDKREATQERLKGIKPVRDFDFKTAPLPHQIEAFNYGMEKNSLLIGDEQGLGKTKESIDICVARKKELIKTLIVCGVNSVKYNWEKEIQIHSNEGCVMVDGKTMDVRVQQLNDWYRGSSYFGVINIESLRNEKIQDALYLGIKDGYIGAIIVDEIHKAKNGGSQQGKALRFLKAPVKIGLSGTPMNKAEDLWNILTWLGVERRSFYSFRNAYCTMGGFGGYKVIGYKNLDSLNAELNTVMLRRKKEEVLDLPPTARVAGISVADLRGYRMASNNIGKTFEQEFKECVPPDYYLYRLKDDTSGFYGVSNPCDYILFRSPYLFMVELKTHKGKSIPIAKIRPNQIQGMEKATHYEGVYGGFLINFRELEETYYITVQDVIQFTQAEERKSIPVEWCRDHGVKIEQKKKRVRYSYDLESWLSRYFGGVK